MPGRGQAHRVRPWEGRARPDDREQHMVGVTGDEATATRSSREGTRAQGQGASAGAVPRRHMESKRDRRLTFTNSSHIYIYIYSDNFVFQLL